MLPVQQLYAKQPNFHVNFAAGHRLSTKSEQCRIQLSYLDDLCWIHYDLGSESRSSHQKQKTVLGPIGCFP